MALAVVAVASALITEEDTGVPRTESPMYPVNPPPPTVGAYVPAVMEVSELDEPSCVPLS
jgi:hypothetical protein